LIGGGWVENAEAIRAKPVGGFREFLGVIGDARDTTSNVNHAEKPSTESWNTL
jgi:hypothetical protein